MVPGGDVRFGVTGKAWRNPPPKDVRSLTFVAAHELAHLWNTDVFHPPDEGSPWLHEGNADLLATAALLRLGQIDAYHAADRLMASSLECEMLVRSRAWKDIVQRERIPYACGLALQFGIVAAARRIRTHLDVFSYWRALWAAHPHYDDSVFEQEARAHSDTDLAALLHEILRDTLPVVEAVRRLYALAGLHPTMSGALGPMSRAMASRQIMTNLMRIDCGGQVNFAGYDDHFEIADSAEHPACRTLRRGMQLVKAQGLDIMKDPFEIDRRLRSVCAEGGPISLGTPDGKTMEMRCPQEWPRSIPISLKPDEVAAVLGTLPEERQRLKPSGPQ